MSLNKVILSSIYIYLLHCSLFINCNVDNDTTYGTPGNNLASRLQELLKISENRAENAEKSLEQFQSQIQENFMTIQKTYEGQLRKLQNELEKTRSSTHTNSFISYNDIKYTVIDLIKIQFDLIYYFIKNPLKMLDNFLCKSYDFCIFPSPETKSGIGKDIMEFIKKTLSYLYELYLSIQNTLQMIFTFVNLALTHINYQILDPIFHLIYKIETSKEYNLPAMAQDRLTLIGICILLWFITFKIISFFERIIGCPCNCLNKRFKKNISNNKKKTFIPASK